jgi:hypothetical protein
VIHSQTLIKVARRTARHLRQTVPYTHRRLQEAAQLLRGQYRRLRNDSNPRLYDMGVPRRQFLLDKTQIIHTCDFLPDQYSLSGTDFAKSPHVDFARRYLSDPDFDYRTSQYYRLAVKGRLAFPCKGVDQARQRCREFIYLINRIRDEGYQPDIYGAVSFVECDGGRAMVLNGKHRLAALMALGIRECWVDFSFANEVRALFRKAVERSWPARFYRKSLLAFEQIGLPVRDEGKEFNRLIKFIRQQKLETWADIYHPIPFHEFRGLSTQITSDAAYRRLEMILTKTSKVAETLRFWILGAMWGFIPCHWRSGVQL